MPVVYKHKDSRQKLTPTEYATEDELQALLAESPGLVMADGEPDTAFVARELNLKTAGNLDVLLVDSEGRPTAVEAKLARNGQSRREVVGQVFDYVSALSQYTVDELDREVDGKLEDALQSFCRDDDDEAALDNLWEHCGVNLRAGRVRVVVAVDDAPEELVRILQYMSDHSDIDVRLVSVKKYSTPDNDVILVPNLLVFGGEDKQVSQGRAAGSSSRQPSIARQEYLAFYKDLVQRLRDRIPVTLPEPAPQAYYKIPTGLPGSHYEWGFHRHSRFSADVHFERSNTAYNQGVVRKVSPLVDAIRASTGQEVHVQERWGATWARIYIERPFDEVNEDFKTWAVDMMCALYHGLQPEFDKIKGT